MKKKQWLVDDWKDAWKWISMNCMAIAGAVQGAWLFIPEDMRQSLPAGLISKLTLALLILGMAGRILKQRDAK